MRSQKNQFGHILDEDKLYVWQKLVVDMVANYKPDDRKIIWILDETGGSGKSALTKHMAVEHQAYVAGESARCQDVAEGFKPDADHGASVAVHVCVKFKQMSALAALQGPSRSSTIRGLTLSITITQPWKV